MAPSSVEPVRLIESGIQRRTVRSYVLRQGRLTAGQAEALRRHWGHYGIEFSRGSLDLNGVFGRRAPRVLDIGSGNGQVTLALAARHPENDYLAVEVHRPGVGSLIRQAQLAGIDNIRVCCHDVVEILRWQLREACLDEVYVFFPDPWPKKRHHKRRLINPAFISLLATRLKPNARLFIATDWEDMAQQALRVCDGEPRLLNLAGAGRYAPRPNWRPQTRFERRSRRLALPVWDLVYAPACGTA